MLYCEGHRVPLGRLLVVEAQQGHKLFELACSVVLLGIAIWSLTNIGIRV